MNDEPHRRLADRVYGLSEWPDGKRRRDSHDLEQPTHMVSVPARDTQLEVAAVLGVSDSLVSDYRRRIEQELRALSFSEVEEARRFESALRERVHSLVLANKETGVEV